MPVLDQSRIVHSLASFRYGVRGSVWQALGPVDFRI